jgi:hypothetical protein
LPSIPAIVNTMGALLAKRLPSPTTGATSTALYAAIGLFARKVFELIFDFSFECCSGFALHKEFSDGLDFIVFVRLFADPAADNVRSAENGLCRQCRSNEGHA